MNRLELPPDCATAADVVERQRRVMQLRQERKAPAFEASAAKTPRRAIADISDLLDEDGGRAKMRLIRHEICRQSGFSLEALDGRGREIRLVLARHLSMSLCARLAGQTFEQIAIAHGYRERHGVSHAYDRMIPVLKKIALSPSASVRMWVAAALPLLDSEFLAREAKWAAIGRKRVIAYRERRMRERVA